MTGPNHSDTPPSTAPTTTTSRAGGTNTSTPSDAPTPQPRGSERLTPRDLVNVGVFSTLYVVIAMAVGMIGVLNPLAALVGFVIGIVANGVVVALFFSRVRKAGGLPLLGLVVGLAMTLTGHPWYTILIATVLGLLGGLVARSGRFRDPKRNALAYGLLCIWFLGAFLPVVWDPAGYTDHVASQMGREYAQAYAELFSPGHLAMFALLFFAVGVASELFGERLTRRHFRRAGVA